MRERSCLAEALGTFSLINTLSEWPKAWMFCLDIEKKAHVLKSPVVIYTFLHRQKKWIRIAKVTCLLPPRYTIASLHHKPSTSEFVCVRSLHHTWKWEIKQDDISRQHWRNCLKSWNYSFKQGGAERWVESAQQQACGADLSWVILRL